MRFSMTVICALILALTAIEGRGQKTQSADLSQIDGAWKFPEAKPQSGE